jgi:hypothetical protein
MSTAPCLEDGILLRGKFRFIATVADGPTIHDCYTLEIFVPSQFPCALPKVRETGGRIRRDGNFHVNIDGTLGLGTPLRLLKKIHDTQSLIGFVDKCLVPFLYAVSYKQMLSHSYSFEELFHGYRSLEDDYLDMFELTERHQVASAIQLLGVEKRRANKMLCPCGCGRRLGVCSFHHKLNEFRKMAHVSWFKAHAMNDWSKL